MPFQPKELLKTPIEYLKGVGPMRGDTLRKELGIVTFGHLLFHFPFRYEDKSAFTKIKDLNKDQENALIQGRIVDYEEIGVGQKSRLVAYLQDDTGSMELLWFRSVSWMKKALSKYQEVQVYGKPTFFNGRFSISHPEIEKVVHEANPIPFFPIYPSTEKMKAMNLSGKNHANLLVKLLELVTIKDLPEILPAAVLEEQRLMPRLEALQQIHFPESEAQLTAAKERLIFEELFIHQLNICKLKLNQNKVEGFVFGKVGDYFNTFYKNHLPFELTDDQKQVLKEIREDTRTGFQMNRLLQGDVGSGKTIVALLAMLIAMDNNFQACLIAPTEILAQQHYQSIKKEVEGQGINVSLLTGSLKASERKPIHAALENGELHILIGTHAILEPKVMFKNLGLCIIDEQHRFGVAQRAKMYKKNTRSPHILVMTATPIPRTLAMTTYGDLDVSVIKKLPPGRKPIRTVHRNDTRRSEVMQFIKTEIDKGRQIYIVYPLIEESAKLDYENLEQGYELVTSYFPDHKYNVAMVHGRQDMEQREHNMQGFVRGDAQILVATTVIEVGVNVPNASVMVIESSERFGLSQLHQLRGRVGRGAEASYCILMTANKISQTAKKRIQTMVNESSGFAISEKDLEIRGPGDIQGTRQSGVMDFKLADIVRDVNILAEAREMALHILKQDPFLEKEENAPIKQYLSKRRGKEIWSRIS